MAGGDRFELSLWRSKRHILTLRWPSIMGWQMGIEPTTLASTVRCSTYWATANILVFPLGIEPRAYRLEVCCYIRLTMETFWLQGSDSNRQSRVYETSEPTFATTLQYGPPQGIRTLSSSLEGKRASRWTLVVDMVLRVGLEPTTLCSSGIRSTKLSYLSLMEPPVGLEPTIFWLQIRCLTSWAIGAYLARKVGLEPTTFRLTVYCSNHLSYSRI